MDPTDNLLLAALPDDERDALLRDAREMHLPLHLVLYEQDQDVDDAYFVLSGAVSLLIELEDGRSLEPAIIGREGVLGFPIGLGDNRSRWRSVKLLMSHTLVSRSSATLFRSASTRAGEKYSSR